MQILWGLSPRAQSYVTLDIVESPSVINLVEIREPEDNEFDVIMAWMIRNLFLSLQVIWLEQQVAKKRVKRFISYHDFDDEKWRNQWYLVSSFWTKFTRDALASM